MSNKINEAELDYRVKYKINKYNVKLIKYKNNQGRQISHVKEFQIIYVDTQPQGDGAHVTPCSLSMGLSSDLLPRSPVWKGEKKSNFLAEKCDTHHLSQVVRQTATVMEHVE